MLIVLTFFCPPGEVVPAKGRSRFQEWYRLSLNSHETQYSVRRLTASVMALAGFVVALLSGMQAANPTSRVIVTAMVALIACHVIGTLLGMIIESVLTDHRRSVSSEMRQEKQAREARSGEHVIVAEEIVEESAKKAA